MKLFSSDPLYPNKKDALKEHETMSELFVKDRFKFELERKERIENLISSISKEHIREELIETQEKLEKVLKNSGSSDNRFILMQMPFWEMVNEKFRPMLNEFM